MPLWAFLSSIQSLRNVVDSLLNLDFSLIFYVIIPNLSDHLVTEEQRITKISVCGLMFKIVSVLTVAVVMAR